MPLYWLCYRHNNQISSSLGLTHSCSYACALAELDEGEFTEGHELDSKWRVPKAMIGSRLTQEVAKRLLSKFERVTICPSSITVGISAETFILFAFLCGREPTNHCKFIHDACEHNYDRNRYVISDAHNGAPLQGEGPSH